MATTRQPRRPTFQPNTEAVAMAIDAYVAALTPEEFDALVARTRNGAQAPNQQPVHYGQLMLSTSATLRDTQQFVGAICGRRWPRPRGAGQHPLEGEALLKGAHSTPQDPATAIVDAARHRRTHPLQARLADQRGRAGTDARRLPRRAGRASAPRGSSSSAF